MTYVIISRNHAPGAIFMRDNTLQLVITPTLSGAKQFSRKQAKRFLKKHNSGHWKLEMLKYSDFVKWILSESEKNLSS